MWIKHWMRAVWYFGEISSRASSWRGFKFQTKIRTFTVNSKSATDIFCIIFHFQVVITDWWLSLTYGGWKWSVWDLWFFPLDTTRSSPLLIGYSISWPKPATIVKPASASTGQIPLLKRSCPNPNSFLQNWSDCCCYFSAVHSFATLLEASHQVILKAFACSPLQSHGQACLCDILLSIGRWGHQNNSFGRLPGSRMGSTWATTQLGRCWGWQMCWVEQLSAAGEGRHYPVDFGWGLILLSGNPWLLSDGGLNVSLSQVYLSSYY